MRQIGDAIGASVMYALTVIVMGCIPMPADTSNLQPIVAVYGNYSLSGYEPAPAPQPDSDVCEACNGTGKSDGRVICPTCNGTGKRTKSTSIGKSVLVHPVKPICTTGSCSTRPTVR